MQQLRKFQLRHRSKFSQLILLDDQARITTSCNSIFDTQPLLDQPVTCSFPFLESIFKNIWSIRPSDANVFFSKIETPIPELPGIYDFTFSKINIEGKELLLWAIYDYTDLYEDFKQFQQRKNELEIHRETLERRYQSLRQQVDIEDQQNIIIENLDHLQLTYFNKLKSALITPVNVLDGLTFFLTNSADKTKKPYLDRLKSTLKQLTGVLEELEAFDIRPLNSDSFQSFYIDNLKDDIKHHFEKKATQIEIKAEEIPDAIQGNYLYLLQVVLGILNNALSLHPQSRFELSIHKLDTSNLEQIKLHFHIKEYLHNQTIFHTEEDYASMIYRLSIIKQIIDLQHGSIQVEKNPKELSISIQLYMNYDLVNTGDK